jgi:hypothetical protein
MASTDWPVKLYRKKTDCPRNRLIAQFLFASIGLFQWLWSPQTARAFAIAVSQNVWLSGTNLIVDSFDSSNPVFSTQGRYDPSKARDGGDIFTSSSMIDGIRLGGSARVYGHLASGSGGTVNVTGAAAVGDPTFNGGGIQPGWWTNNMNFSMPSVSLPYTSALIPHSGYVVSTTYINGTTIYTTNFYDHVLIGGDYSYGDALSGKTLVISDARLVLPNGLQLSNNDRIEIVRGTLEIYCGGATCNIDGQGITNKTGYAGRLLVYCLPSVTNLTLSGGSGFTGVIVAPNADMTINSTGSQFDFVGCSMTKSLTNAGNLGFHFDEALYQIGLRISYQPQNLSLLSGGTASFRVYVNGIKPFHYQWQFNGVNLPDSTNDTLTLSNVTLSQAGQYSAVITNLLSSTTSAVATLSVYGSAAAILSSQLNILGEFQTWVTGVPGFNYALETSTNLLYWVPILTNQSPFFFADPQTRALPRRYFRSRYIP